MHTLLSHQHLLEQEREGLSDPDRLESLACQMVRAKSSLNVPPGIRSMWVSMKQHGPTTITHHSIAIEEARGSDCLLSN